MSEPIKPGDIDGVIHERARLSIVSALAVTAQLSFNELKSMLGLTDGNLSVHARTLEEAGYIVVDKSFQGRRPHTAMRLTPKGRKAFARYLETLRQIVEQGSRERAGFFVVFPFPSPFFSSYTLCHKALYKMEAPGGSPLKTRLVSWSVAALRASQGWLQALDQILRGETTRPSALREQSLQIPLAGLSLLILALALFYGFCMGMYPGCRDRRPLGAALAGMHAEDTGPFRAHAVRHLSFAVRRQCPGRIAAAVAGGLAASRGGLGREPGGPGVDRPDRGLLLLQHDELPFHGLAQRPGVCGFGASGDGLSVANAAPHEHDSRNAADRRPRRDELRRRRETERAGGRGEPAERASRRARPAGHVAVVGAERWLSDPKGPQPPTRRPRRSSSSRRGSLCPGSPGRPRLGPAREDGLLLLDGDLQRRRCADGLGAAALFRQRRPEPFVWFGPRTSNFFEGVWQALQQAFYVRR